MYTFINKKYLFAVLLFMWLSYSANLASLAITENNKVKDKFSWKNSRININCAIPFTHGPLFPLFKIGTTKEQINITNDVLGNGLNFSLEALAVYNFIDLLPPGNFKFDLALGISYPFPRIATVKTFNIILIEHHLKVPLYLIISRKFLSYFRFSGLIGYEFEYILNSQYKQSGYYSDLSNTMQGNKNIKNFLPNVRNFWSNIVFGISFGFPKGINLDINMYIIPSLYQKNIYNKRHNKLDGEFLTLMRACMTPSMEFKLGVNIMEWFFPKE